MTPISGGHPQPIRRVSGCQRGESEIRRGNPFGWRIWRILDYVTPFPLLSSRLIYLVLAFSSKQLAVSVAAEACLELRQRRLCVRVPIPH